MKNGSLLFLFFFVFLSLGYSQEWTKVEKNTFRHLAEERWNIPNTYESYTLDINDFEFLLKNAPDRFQSKGGGITINWPMPDGKMQKFNIKRSDVFHPDLAAKFPNIKAFTGYSTSDPTAILKISMSHKGIEGMLLSDRHETVYLDRYLPKSKEEYILYKKSDYQRVLGEEVGTCLVKEPKDGHNNLNSAVRFGDCQLRKYRLALACTGEYADFHGGNIADVMAEFNASMVRVNGIYEKEVAITLELIPNNDQLIFLNADLDPYNNENGQEMLNQNQAAVDLIIGFDNYDIGHVFSTGGGGIANLRSPCTNRKAQGVTGLSNPTGDPFWVDYVSHEMGHQFGCTHTQNNDCQRFENTAVEPGSASTIMGYAGICIPNIQSNSDDYFHAVSISQIANFVIAGNGDCAELIPLDNSAPEIIGITATGQALPAETPFFLTAEAVDIDDDLLTYCWEQMDNEIATMPPVSNSTFGPAFRSIAPKESPTRYFPSLPSILFGINNSIWEVLPSEDREMKFNVTVRDNFPLGGCTTNELLSVSFTSSAGPFLITAPNTFQTWSSGDTETITWDVAETDEAPVSCGHVDILLSLDQGKNFDIILAENVANDGEHDITVPYKTTSQGRIMVRCSNKTFFDINNRNINILAPFSLDISPSALSICPNSVATYSLDYTVLGMEPYPVTFDLIGLPAGASFNFSPSETSLDTEVILTLENLTSNFVGSYELEVITTGANGVLAQTVELIIEADQNIPVQYLSPDNGETGVALDAMLSWEKLPGIFQYDIEISDSPKFENIIFSTSTENIFTYPTGLESSTIYYWRARGHSNCILPSWQNIQSFQTNMITCKSGSITPNIPINSSNSNNVESGIVLIGEGAVQDLVVTVEINHTRIGDLTAKLSAPDGTEAVLFDRPGFPNTASGCEENNIEATFTATAANSAQEFELTCNFLGNAIEGTYRPLEPFAIFNNKPIEGNWTLIVDDSFQGDGGALVSWSLENCESSVIESGVLLKNNELLLEEELGAIDSNHLEVQTSDPINTFFTIISTPSFGAVQKINTPSGMFENLNIGDQFTQQDLNTGQIRYVLTNTNTAEDQFKFDTQDDQLRYTHNNTFQISTGISPLTITANITQQISCFSEMDGRIEASASGGIPGYEYSINDGPFQSINVFENLEAGDYVIEVKDNFGTLVSSQVLTLVEPEKITFTFNRGNNAITIDAQGGTGSLMYSLDGINYTTESTIPISDGTTYRIYIKDENDCMTQSSTAFIFYQIVEAEIFAKNVDCKGYNNGSIEIGNVTGGLAPYSYQLNDQPPTTLNIFDNLSPDTYRVRISDSSGGIDYIQMNIIISEPDEALSISSEVIQNTITLIGAGGTEPYLYSLNGIDYTSDNVFKELEDGEYTGYITDANDCQISQSSIIVKSSTIESLIDRLHLFPNPTANNFTFGSTTNLKLALEIRDIAGKLLFKGSALTNNPISAAFLAPGLYILKITYKQNSKLYKLSRM